MQVYTIKRYINADKLQFIDFHFALRSPCTIFEEDRLRLGHENESFLTFILHCTRLALSLKKTGCGSAMKMKVF